MIPVVIYQGVFSLSLPLVVWEMNNFDPTLMDTGLDDLDGWLLVVWQATQQKFDKLFPIIEEIEKLTQELSSVFEFMIARKGVF